MRSARIEDLAVEGRVSVLLVPPVRLRSGIWLPCRTGLAGGKGLVTNLGITTDVLNAVLMGYSSVVAFNNYLAIIAGQLN